MRKQVVHYLISYRAYMAGMHYRACDHNGIFVTKGRNKKQGSFSRKDVICKNCRKTKIFRGVK